MRLVSFNAQHARRPDGAVDSRLLADVCSSFDADVLCVQELDRWAARSHFARQPNRIATATGMFKTQGYARRLGLIGRYGIAVFTREQPFATQVVSLPHDSGEPRVAVVVHLTQCTVIGTHLSPPDAQRALQWHALARVIRNEKGPLVLLGDFNAHPAEALKHFGAMGLQAVESELTFPSDDPSARIDYCALRDLDPHEVEVRAEPLSDHRALVVDVSTPMIE